MNIGYVYPHLLGEGGYPRDVQRMLKELNATNRVQVIPIPTTIPRGARARVGVTELLLLPELLAALPRLDIVHFFGLFFPGYPLLARAVSRYGVPYIVSPLSAAMPLALAKGEAKKRFFLRVGGSAFLQRARVVHSLSETETSALRALGVITPVVEHSLGLYPEDLPSDVVATPAGAPEDYLLCFGRLDVYHKGLDLLLDGFADYARRADRYKLVIAGRSWNGSHDYLKQRIAALRLADRVILLGEVSLEAKFALLARCQALIYPTRHDGPPRPIRDALCLGKRLLITYEANMPSHIERFGWGYQFNAVSNELAEAILRLASEGSPPPFTPPLDVLAWPTIAREWLDTYESIRRVEEYGGTGNK